MQVYVKSLYDMVIKTLFAKISYNTINLFDQNKCKNINWSDNFIYHHEGFHLYLKICVMFLLL